MTINRFDGQYHFLSNFYPCTIEYQGIVYPSTEHAYQAAKTLDPELRQKIADMETPGKAKRGGKILPMREDWEEVKYKVMEEILWLKFDQPEFERMLLDTGDALLVEGNTWHDNIWGNCICDRCKDIKGTNWLGDILVDIRCKIILYNEYTKIVREEIDNEILEELNREYPNRYGTSN